LKKTVYASIQHLHYQQKVGKVLSQCWAACAEHGAEAAESAGAGGDSTPWIELSRRGRFFGRKLAF
jgi:hypothetical protein